MAKIIEEYIKFPFYILTHPIKGFDELKEKENYSLIVGTIFIILSCLAMIMDTRFSSMIVNTNNPLNFNAILVCVYTIVPVVLVCVANWSVTTLMDGKGSFKNIYKVITYSLFPFFICTFLACFISQIITLDEAAFYTMLKSAGFFLMAFMALIGLLVVHEFTVAKMAVSIVATIVSICIILFLAITLFDVSQQITGFISSLYDEIMLRIGWVMIC